MFHECINLKIRIDDKLCNLICLDRFPSQNMEEFEMFGKNLEFNLELVFTKNSYLTIVIGDFNVKLHNWYKGNKTTASWTKLEIMTSHYGLTQIISKPTHMLEDASSCIDFIFKSQPNMVLNDAVHQTVFAKFNLRDYYPPPCEKHIWHYEYANTVQIKNAIASFN